MRHVRTEEALGSSPADRSGCPHAENVAEQNLIPFSALVLTAAQRETQRRLSALTASHLREAAVDE